METLINLPRTKRGKNTLNNILSAAVQLFYEKGYHNTSINEITSLAGGRCGNILCIFRWKI